MSLRYSADQHPPHKIAAFLALQNVALVLSGIVLTPLIVLRAGSLTGDELAWSVFVALLVAGLTTMLQSRPIGRFGAGYILFMGTSGAFISVGLQAIEAGGMALLCTLIVCSSSVEFLMANRLAALRRLITPTVGGIAGMLIAVTVMPIAFDMLAVDSTAVEPGMELGPVLAAGTTLLIIIGTSFFGSRGIRLWSALFGLIGGMIVAALFGMVDPQPLLNSDWIGLPTLAWPGFDLSFGESFWALMPAFIIVTLVGTVETYGDGIAIQRLSWHEQRPTDYRSVQGALYADGLGNLISGLGGTLPNTTYSASISTVDMTGIASRRVGVYGGAIILLIAFFPKVASLLLIIPQSVVASYLIVLVVLLFMQGLHSALEEGFSFDRALVIGLSLWLGIGFQNQQIFQDMLPFWAATLFGNGMTSGVLIAIFLTALLRLKEGRRRRLEVALDMRSLPQVHRFTRQVAAAAHCDASDLHRLELAAEEALMLLVEHAGDSGEKPFQLQLVGRLVNSAIELDLASAPLGVNLQALVVPKSDAPGRNPEDDFAFRILHSMVDEMTHQQYHGADFLTLKIIPHANFRQ